LLDQVVFLDPHTTQAAGADSSVGLKETEAEIEADEKFHTRKPMRMDMEQMDPSLALVSQNWQKKSPLMVCAS
jgi:hypothetical protein